MTSRTERDAWREALLYLLRYETVDSYQHQRVIRAKGLIEELIRKGSLGELTSARFTEVREALNMQEHRIARDAWTTNVHSVVCTSDWMDRLGEALKGKTVLELGAARGTLMQPMNKRGVKWIGLQTDPDTDCRFKPIPVKNYIEALYGYRGKIDFIFASWPAYTMRGHDFTEIALKAKEFDIPLILVAERRIITSSSNTLWDSQSAYGYRLVQAMEYQPDRWRGVRDSLWVLVDDKHLTQKGDRSKFTL
tara:strand:- start:1386 stop:2135 length:750 start_codon:yes stop_codon:yes gene_type:complete